jgi:hypothetical protein
MTSPPLINELAKSLLLFQAAMVRGIDLLSKTNLWLSIKITCVLAFGLSFDGHDCSVVVGSNMLPYRCYSVGIVILSPWVCSLPQA